MKNWNNENEAREKIKELVAEYYHDFKEGIVEIIVYPSIHLNFIIQGFQETDNFGLF